MRISEIAVSEAELTFDILKDNIAAEVHNRYVSANKRSSGFIVSALDSYDPEELSDLIDEFQDVFTTVKTLFDLESQTYQITKYLIDYLTD